MFKLRKIFFCLLVFSLISCKNNTLNKMLRNQAIADGLEEQWNHESKRKRREVARRNLEKVNVKN